MNKNKALSILKISGFTSNEDLDIHYKKEKDRLERSILRSNSDSVKKAYQAQLKDLEVANQFLRENKEQPGLSVGLPKFKIKTAHIVMISAISLVVIGYISFTVIRKNKINDLLEEGTALFETAKIGSDRNNLIKAKRLFEEAEKKGSIEGKFYHGLIMHKLGNKQGGMVKMQRAEKDGFSDSTMNFKIYQTWKTQLNSK